MKKFADIVLRYRLSILVLILAITAFFVYEMATRLKVTTNFEELLPQTHPYIQMHKQFRKQFGGANLLIMMIRVKEGDIFNTKTLSKVKYIQEQMEQVPGVDRYKMLSIAARKMKT